jgi:SAM-dependent methyltransferase
VRQIRKLVRWVVPLRVRRPLGIEIYHARQRATDLRERVLGQVPILAVRDLVYDDRFYDSVDAPATPLYQRMVEALVRLRSPRSVVDIGCGSGVMLAKFADQSVFVRGVEGSRAAIRRSPLADRIVRANLERGVPDVGRFDLCLCIEVAEHLSSRSAAGLVDGLTRLSDVVVFTAAPPGQPGTAHLNPQPKSYWRALFAGRGFPESSLERELLEAIADVPQPEYIHANLMVFEKACEIDRAPHSLPPTP